MILKANAAKGPLSVEGRVVSSPVLGSIPLIAGTSVGAGM